MKVVISMPANCFFGPDQRFMEQTLPFREEAAQGPESNYLMYYMVD